MAGAGVRADVLTDAATAVREHVEPGMCVHFAFTHNRSHVLAWELARAFRRSRSLNLVGTGLLDYAVVLAASEAVASGVSAFAGITYPAPRPSPALQRLASAEQSDPNWTNLTITLRLMAGALGLPAIPTRSLSDTDLAHGDGRAEGINPFTGERMMLLTPLRPDVAFVHVPVADTRGNAFVQGPFGEDLWGAWAAERVIVSAERVVQPDVLRGLGPGIGLPAHRVTAIVEAPFGAHPQAQYVWDPRLGVEPYAEDYEFRAALRAAQRDSARLTSWIAEWIDEPRTHDAYLERLGQRRLSRLRAAAAVASRPAAGATADLPATAEEQAAGVAMDVVRKRFADGRSDLVFAGIGLSHLAAWSACAAIAQAKEPPVLIAETGLVDFTPATGDPYLFNPANTRSAILHDGFLRMLGAAEQNAGSRCLALLSAAQVDAHGAVNSSYDARGRFIVGSGGANDLAAADCDVLVVLPLTPERSAAELPFATSRPRHLVGVACDYGLLEPAVEDGELMLTAVVAGEHEAESRVREARAQCAWPLRVSRELTIVDPIGKAELQLLRQFDPERALLGHLGTAAGQDPAKSPS
jgi:acyl CoA:acetate/3-ketoacid CoA transferase alpha subunit/acyl CoA:acetate/3-ketoacid CoA transferase beta subunit